MSFSVNNQNRAFNRATDRIPRKDESSFLAELQRASAERTIQTGSLNSARSAIRQTPQTQQNGLLRTLAQRQIKYGSVRNAESVIAQVNPADQETLRVNLAKDQIARGSVQNAREAIGQVSDPAARAKLQRQLERVNNRLGI